MNMSPTLNENRRINFFHEARNKARDKTWKEVISLLKKSNALHQTLRNLNLLARAYAELRQFDEAEKCFMKILRSRPDNPKFSVT